MHNETSRKLFYKLYNNTNFMKFFDTYDVLVATASKAGGSDVAVCPHRMPRFIYKYIFRDKQINQLKGPVLAT